MNNCAVYSPDLDLEYISHDERDFLEAMCDLLVAVGHDPEELYSDRQVHSQRLHLPFWIQQTKSTCEPREPAAVRTKSENETGVLGRTVEIESAPSAAACRDLGRRDMSVPTIATGVLGRREMSVPSAEAGLGLGRASIDEQLLSSLTPDVRSASGFDRANSHLRAPDLTSGTQRPKPAHPTFLGRTLSVPAAAAEPERLQALGRSSDKDLGTQAPSPRINGWSFKFPGSDIGWDAW